MAKETPKNRIKRPTAEKRMDQNEKHRIINKVFKTKMRTTVRTFETSLKSGKSETIKECLNSIYSMMDQGVKRGIFKQNNANRTKARSTAKAAAAISAES